MREIQRRALLMIDIVDSTRLAEAIGDAAMAAVWEKHDRVARDLLREWRGREIDKTDGFMLLFGSALDAVGYAQAYHRAIWKLDPPLQARAAVHVGDVALRETPAEHVAAGAKPLDADGLAKPVTARVLGIAQGGQTLLTSDAKAAVDGTSIRLHAHGHWCLKGVEKPMELFEVLDLASPPVEPCDGDKAYRVVFRDGIWTPLRDIRHTVPAERDGFIGRSSVLQALSQYFDTGTRCLSILGPGGVGKTRVACRFARLALAAFSGGAWFCDLATARGADGICHAVAQGLDITVATAKPVEQIGEVLAARGDCLVVLDNFEQVADFAAATLGAWLDRAPSARFLVTSREVLGLRGEQALVLGPLDASEGARLFMVRAASATADFQSTPEDDAAIPALIHLLDGLPLAIELAAARVRVLPPKSLLERMDRRFALLATTSHRGARQSALRTTLDWSWDLLSQAEQLALAQLSVFEGGFTLSAAEAVLDLSSCIDPPWPLDAMQALVDKSLVRVGPTMRFDMLATIREYAIERLQSLEPRPTVASAAERRHWKFFATLTSAQATADKCIEIDNLVLACRRATLAGDMTAAVAALEAAWKALSLRGPYAVGIQLADRLNGQGNLEPAERLRTELIAGRARQQCGQPDEAEAHFSMALSLAGTIGDRRNEGRILHRLGDIATYRGQMETAGRLYDESHGIAIEVSDQLLQCEILNSKGSYHEFIGDLDGAHHWYMSALTVARAIGDRRWEGGILGNLGQLFANRGAFEEASDKYQQSIEISRHIGDATWEGNALCNLGLLQYSAGRPAEARENLLTALGIARHTGHRRLEAAALCNVAIAEEALGDTEHARCNYLAAIDVARALGDRRAQGQFLGYYGLLLAKAHDLDGAFAALASGEALLRSSSDPISLAILLCQRAEADWVAGRIESGAAPYREAAEIASTIPPGSSSELEQCISALSTKFGSKKHSTASA